MPGEVDEFGIPVKKKAEAPVASEVDEFGIPLKKKEPSVSLLPSGSLLASPGAGSQLAGGSLEPGDINYLTGQNDIKINPPTVPVQPLPTVQNEADLIKSATTGGQIPLDQNTYDPQAYEKAKARQGLDGDVFEAFARGSAGLASGIMKTPAFLYDIATGVTNKVVNAPLNAVTGGAVGYMPTAEEISKKLPADNPISQIDAAIESSNQSVQKKYDKDITDYFFGENKDYDKGIRKLAIAVAEAAPVTISLMMGNAAGASPAMSTLASTAVFGAEKKADIDNQVEEAKVALRHPELLSPEELEIANSRVNMHEMDKITNSVANGFFEGFFEQFGVTKLGGAIKDIFTREGAAAAKKFAEKSFRGVYGPLAKKYLGIAAEESISEGLTQFSQNVSDWMSGLNPKADFFKGVPDAMTIGLAMGGPMAGVTGAIDVAVTAKNRKRAGEIVAQKKALEDDLLSEDVNASAKAVIVKKIRDLNEVEADLFQSEKELMNNLSPEAKKEITHLQEKAKDLADATIDDTVSEDTKEILAKELEANDKEIDKVIAEDKAAQAEAKVAEKKKPTKKEGTKKPVDEPASEDIQGEIEYLRSIEQNFGDLTQEEKDQLAALEEKVKPKPTDKEEATAPASEKPVVENKSPDSATPEVAAPTSEVAKEAPIDKSSEIAAIEKELATTKQKFFDEKISYLDYRKKQDALKAKLEAFSAEETQKVSPETTSSEEPATTPTANTETGTEQKQEVKTEPVKKTQDPVVEPSVEQKPKPKKEKIKQELIDEEDQADEQIKDSPEATAKLDTDIELMKKMPTNDLAEKKYVGMIERAWKAKEEGKISRSTYTAFRNAANDVLEGKVAGKDGVKATEAKLKVTSALNKVKEKLLGQGYEKITLSTAIPISPKTVADLIDMAGALARRGIDAGFTIADATTKALNAIRNHPAYKKLVKDGTLKEKDFEDAVKASQEKPKKKKDGDKAAKKTTEKPNEKKEPLEKKEPVEEGGEKKSFLNRIHKAENISKETKAKIEKNGLTYTVFSHEEANQIAKGIVASEGIEGAMNVARTSTEVPGSAKTMIYAEVINEYRAKEKAAKTTHEKEYFAHMQGVIADELDQFLRDSGRVISAVNHFYEMSPLGIASKEIAGIQRQNEKKKVQGGLTGKRNSVVSALNAIEDAPATEEKPSAKKIKEIKKKRSSLLDELKQSFGNLGFAATPENQAALMDKQIRLIAKIAGTYLEEGFVRADEVIKRIKRDVKKATGLKISNEDLERVMNENVGDDTLKGHIEKRRTVRPSKPVDQQVAKQREDIQSKKRAALERLLPKKRNQSSAERKQDHDRLLSAHENGAFDGSARTYMGPDGKETTETFEDILYERYGLTNVNKPEFKAKMKELAHDIHKTPKDSSLRSQAYQAMYDYIAKYQAKSYADLVGGIWYAHILSSYETHLRNLKYNSFTVGLNQTVLLAEKALLKGRIGEFVSTLSDGMKAFATGYYEAREILKNGAVSRFDKPGVRNEVERSKSVFLKLHKIPGRALRASDILFTLPLYEMKQRELMYDYVRSEAKAAGQNLTPKEIRQRVTDYLGRTPQRIETAKRRAENDIESVFGSDWKTNKKAVSNYKIRVSEILEETRPEAVKEEAIQWAKRSVLTNEPRGIYKQLASVLNSVQKVPGGKFVVPFVNVMMNLTDRMIERSPVGFINAMRGKKGFGESAETLTPDERMELTLKAINYTVGVAGLMAGIAAAGGFDDDDAPVVITGANEGEYSKDKVLQQGGKLDPYSVYVNGEKVMEYKDSPMSSWFAPVGYYRDFHKFGENTGAVDGMVKAGFDYMSFVADQNAMKGLSEFMRFLSPEEYRKLNAESVAKSLASTGQNFFIPNILKAVNNDVRGAFGYNDYKAQNWREAFFKDVPFAEQLMVSEKYDHLGQPIKDQFKVPLVPYEKWQAVDPYYKLFTDHKFYPSYMRDKVVVVGNRNEDSESFSEVELTPEQTKRMHELRGDLIKKFLNTKTDGGTIMSDINKLDDETFATRMASLFSKAAKIAKTKLFNGKEIRESIPDNSEEADDLNDELKRAIRGAARDSE